MRFLLNELWAIVKPDAVQKANEIESMILENGFTILHVCFYLLNHRMSKPMMLFRNDVLF